MDCFETMTEMGHEQVVWCHHRESGLRAIIAIHDTTLGPSLGGCRFYNYKNEREALIDVLRLSRGMTYKAAVAGLDLGGGKSVIIGDPSTTSEAMFRAFGRFVHSLGGRYITAEDMNTSEREMAWVHRETPHVTGLSTALGGNGDPGPVTAWGCYHGVRAALKHVYGTPDPRGRKIAIQGVGSVGYGLAKHLHEAGAKLSFSDINERNIVRAMEDFGGTVLSAEEFYSADVDVLAPCAIGATINERTIPLIKAPIIAGSANNQLEDEQRDAAALQERKITYAPDFVINAGGLMHVDGERQHLPVERAMETAAGIYDTVARILAVADEHGTPSLVAAKHLAEKRLADVRAVQRLRL